MNLNEAKHNLNVLYEEVQKVILSKQNPVTGLLPASTSVNAHGDYTDAWVRDNVYSIVAPWALSLAFKKQGDMQRSDELEQSVIKLMRGLLQSMMRQADKVESFKQTLNPLDALHAKYSTNTGLPVVADDAWGHLQIDATSLFLLMLAQMSDSGLRIVRTYDEVDFVQNLIYYIASAYRTPDYGIWERGNKINNGNAEINASSLGMAKAALQALDKLNLFGPHGSPRAVVHSVADALSLARTNLAALLPRESLSKEVDSALLSIIGFPAFAVGDAKLAGKTRDAILKKLGGKYGLKRFLWDGHQTCIEDPSRLYYEHSELANFEHIESEWPLFYCYLYLNALFAGNMETAKYYRQKIEGLMIEKDGLKLIPELYYVPEENITEEKRNPNTQNRIANDNLPLVWAQSLFYTALLIDEGYIESDALDPRKLRRNTTQLNHAQVALVVLAENKEVKKTLAENGVIAESLEDIEPLNVISAPHLVEAYSQVGANDKLKLSGRPKRRLLSLATSQSYNINGQSCLCLSWVQGDHDYDYSQYDAELITRMLSKEISHIRHHWLNSEVAVFTFMVQEKLCRSANAHHLYSCLRNYQLRISHENIGYASANLAFRASKENKLYIPGLCMSPIVERFAEVEHEHDWNSESKVLLEKLNTSQHEKIQLLDDFFSGKDLSTPASMSDDKISYKHLLQHIYQQALEKQEWLVARMTFVLQGHAKSDLSDYLSVLSARHFSVIVGKKSSGEFGLNPSLSNKEIVEVLRDSSTHPVEHCLLQELLELIGVFQRTRPQLFEGLRSIHLHNLLGLCAKREKEETRKAFFLKVGALSPNDILEKLIDIFESLYTQFSSDVQSTSTAKLQTSAHQAVDMDWFDWHYERGMILRLDREFLEAIWNSLSLTPQLIFGDSENPNCVINCGLVRKSMTPGEEIFARLIDTALAQLHPPYFKSAIAETLRAMTHFHQQNPEKKINQAINLELILEKAAQLYCHEEHQSLPSTRNIDLFLEEPPTKLASYFDAVFTSL
ncbi:phosphorylase kinase alpha/beta subunit [Alteromonadaceae bacterium Bs31]|nr:phosphorylase kinase alpha/beta subunit [Alteromonadaceae bacterium Bs31]